MMDLRKQAAELEKAYPIICEPAPDKDDMPDQSELMAKYPEDKYPSTVVLVQMERELVLTRAKLHQLRHDKDAALMLVCLLFRLW
jgi:hypothetical protein